MLYEVITHNDFFEEIAKYRAARRIWAREMKETFGAKNPRSWLCRFHENRGTNYREKMVEMHISEIGLCSGHSASGVWTDENARTTVPGLYAAGDLGSVPHNSYNFV